MIRSARTVGRCRTQSVKAMIDPVYCTYCKEGVGIRPRGSHHSLQSRHIRARWKATSSFVIAWIGLSPCIRRRKLWPMLIAPFVSRLRGVMQSLCVQSRSPRILYPIFFSILSQARGARPQAPAARLARAVLRGRRHHEALRQLPHEVYPDARWEPTSASVLAGDESPRAVRQDERTLVRSSVCSAWRRS